VLLNCHTYYSLRYGTLGVEELIAYIKQNGYNSFVLTDINTSTAVIETIRQCKEQLVKCCVGIDFRNNITQQYIGIAKNNKGYAELNKHLSQHLHNSSGFEKKAPVFKNAYVIYPLQSYEGQALLKNEFIGINEQQLKNLPFSPHKHLTKKMVVLQTLTFKNKSGFNAHRLLRAIQNNTLLSKLPKEETANPENTLKLHNLLLKSFADYPQIIKNTEHILKNCSVDFEFGKLANKTLKYYTNSFRGDVEKLKEETYNNLSYRYPNPEPVIFERIEKELGIIEKMNFAAYFLINWDITNYARKQGFVYVGRGSGANSMVAYILKITDVDPIDLDLYFERFINEHRNNAPDFDIDFSWTDRDHMTRYIFERFGYERTALLGSYNTFQFDATVRELGKVFGLPTSEIDKLQSGKAPETLDQLQQLVLKYSHLIQGFPNHLSIHASGIVISEEPIVTYCATFLPPKGYPTTQFSMLEAEDIGLFKFDILSQRGLGKIHDAVKLIKENQNTEIDIRDIKRFKVDSKINSLLKEGKCIGCFYVESPAMRMLLSKLQAEDYLRLVAASSIIRPGVSKSGMMHEYIERYRNIEKQKAARNALPELYDILKETYGVMVYQEDVIKVAHLFAGLTLAEADYLRRGMSWKFKQQNEFDKVKQKFYNNCFAKKYKPETIDRIWNQIESFANFAFAKGHSASYAVESYQAMYLKAYYPIEYMVATLNNGGGFYRKELYLHEARLNGAEIKNPCVNNSEQLCVVKNQTVYIGLAFIAELETTTTLTLLAERQKNGNYKNPSDFIKRTGISVQQTQLLIRVGAFSFYNSNKKELMWESYLTSNPGKSPHQTPELFETENQKYKLPQLNSTSLDDALDEIELLGFSLCSPFKLVKEPIKNKLVSADLKKHLGKTVEIIGYLITTKPTRTAKGDKMCFGTFVDIDGAWIDTVHFPAAYKTFPFTGPGCYRIVGLVETEYDFIFINVSHLYRMPSLNREDNHVTADLN
jgi:DNA polymerase-3 subunit alpha